MKQPIFEPDPADDEAVQKLKMGPLTKFLLELGPLLIFFFTNYRGEWLIKNVPLFSVFDQPLFLATAVFMVAIIIALAISWFIARTLPVMPLISGLLVLVFGGLTLWLHDEIFIKMKPTIVNVLFGAVLFGGLAFKKPLLGYVFDSAFRLDGTGWHKLTVRWAWFFLFLAIVNEIVWRNFSTDFWASFKVFGIMPITFLFLIFQAPLLMRHSLDLKEAREKENQSKP